MQPGGANRNKIKRARELKGWSQADVAEKLGCDARSVGRWERGVVSPSTYYRQKLCLLFEQNIEELGFLKEPIEDAQELAPLEQELAQEQGEKNIEEPGLIEDAQGVVPSEQELAQEQGEKNIEEPGLIEDAQVPSSEPEVKTVQVLSGIETYPQSQKRGYRFQYMSILHNTPVRIFIELCVLFVLVLGSIIIFTSFHFRNIPYGKLLYTTTAPGSKCDRGGGQWSDYHQPGIQCLATKSIINNSSSTSPDLRGIILTSIPNNTYPDNYVLQAQIQQPSTSADFGLYFRNQPGDQQGSYTFFIHPDGSWGAYIYDNVTAAQNQIASGMTSIDPYSQLYLTVVAIGPDFTFYVNRRKVGEVHDATYSMGGVGVAVDAGGTIVVSKVGLYSVA